MIYSAKIRRMSRRRQKIAVRRKLRNILLAELQSFIGRQVGRNTMALMLKAMATGLEELHHTAVISSARLHDDVLHMRVYLSPPKPAPAIRTPVFFSTL